MKIHPSLTRHWCILIIGILAISSARAQDKAPMVSLSKDGQAVMPIIISEQASEQTRNLGQTLSEYLQKISGGNFKVQTLPKELSSSTKGIALGTAAEFPDLAKRFDGDEATMTEDYLLQSHPNGLLVVGATDLGLSHAVWDLLYRLGYRQFFPGPRWEVIPTNKDISIAISTFEHPDYYARRIWPGYGALPDNRSDWDDWNARNRMASGISLSTGHAYGAIIHRHQAEFKAHPEYLTKPDSTKFCVSNKGLQQLVISDALAQLEKNPDRESISMEPSDGGGWESDSCPDATIYANVTDRAISLANLVAEAIAKKYTGKYVGLYAYNEHSPPPTIEVHPNVIPSIATSFIRGGFTLEELLDGWDKKSQALGIREYYSVFSWDRDLPGKARGANLDYLVRTVPHFHDKGARFITAESSDNWGPNGLGYYIASRLMWNVADAKNVTAIRADFLDKAFGSAREPMDVFYDLIDGSNNPLFSEDLIGRMYRQLDAALQRTDDAKIRARILDLALYTRYVELYRQLQEAKEEAHQDAFVNLLRYSWRIRQSEMVHTLGIWRGLARYEKVTIPDENTFRVPAAQNPWKSEAPVTTDEALQIIADGIAHNKLREFDIKTFSDDLIKADALHLTVPSKRPVRAKFGYLRGTHNVSIWLDGPITVQAKAGTIYTNRGSATLTLHQSGEVVAENLDAAAPIASPPLQTFEVPPDKQWHEYTLNPPRPGIYVLRLADSSMGTELDWPQSMPVTVKSTLDNLWTLRARTSLYFYVPRGTKSVGGFAKGSYHLYGADGKVLLSDQDGYFNIPVPEGQDGKLWEFGFASGDVALLTVPSYLARSPQELMLPREVVEADTK